MEREGGQSSSRRPIDRGAEIRCYVRDPDGYLIEVGQSTGLLAGNLLPSGLKICQVRAAGDGAFRQAALSLAHRSTPFDRLPVELPVGVVGTRVRSTSPNGRPVARATSTPRTEAPVL
jgi:hypothetical protein